MRPALLIAASALAIAAAPPPAPPAAGDPPRMMAITVFGNDPCPRSTSDEIVVCAREPESERYRLPKRFRGKAPVAAQGSWANTAKVLEMVSRQNIPNSCSPIGSYGQTGCFQKFIEENRRDPAPQP